MTYQPMLYDSPTTFASSETLTAFLAREKTCPQRDHPRVKQTVTDLEAELEKRSRYPETTRPYWVND